jgi:hypothetical protein
MNPFPSYADLRDFLDISGGEIAPLLARLATLDEFFQQLETFNVKGRRRFEGWQVIGITVAAFLPAVASRKGLEEEKARLAEEEKALQRVIPLSEKGLVPVDPRAYARRDGLRLAQAVLKQRKQLRSKKCPVLSGLITGLCDYFFRCESLRADHPQKSEVYELVGRVINALSEPCCLLCGTPHRFDDWTGIRARDKKKHTRR